MFITREMFERLQQTVLDNFNPPDNSHPSWHLNPEQMVLALLQVLGVSVSDPAEDPLQVLRASLASRGFEELSGYESLEPGMTVRGTRMVATGSDPIVHRYPVPADATLLHIFRKISPWDVRLLVRLDDGSVKEWVADEVKRDG